MEAYILTGTSGSGKTTALKAFEDLDFYCVDNIPVVLLEKFFEVIVYQYVPRGNQRITEADRLNKQAHAGRPVNICLVSP